MDAYYCCYWCYTVYDKKKVEQNVEIYRYGNGFQILGGYCRGKFHQNRRSRCDLYEISNELVFKSLSNKIYLKEERLFDFLDLCQKKLCARNLFIKKILPKKRKFE